MSRIEIYSQIVVTNKPPSITNARIEPVKLKTDNGATQHGFKIIPLRSFVGHQHSDHGKNAALERRRKEAREKKDEKHKRHGSKK
jgi:hypothetical protein